MERPPCVVLSAAAKCFARVCPNGPAHRKVDRMTMEDLGHGLWAGERAEAG